MARIRTIKPEFFTSLTVASLPLEARLTFIGLWTHADDEGRCVDDTRLIRAALWPLDDRSFADVEKDLQQLADASLIVRYTVGGKRFLVVSGWREHQRINRPTRSKLPAPPAGDGEAATSQDALFSEDAVSPHDHLTDASLGERKGTGKGKERKGTPSGGRATARPAKRGQRIPDDFTVTPDMVAWAREKTPHVNGRVETEKFINFWQAKAGAGATKLDWVRTWRNWMLTAAERAPTGRSGSGFQPYRNTNQPNPPRAWRNDIPEPTEGHDAA